MGRSSQHGAGRPSYRQPSKRSAAPSGTIHSHGRSPLQGDSRSRKRRGPAHIDNVAPTAQDRARSHVRRHAEQVGRGSFAEEGLKRSQRRKKLVILLLVVLAIAIAVAAGVFMYFKATDRNLDLTPSNAEEALVAASDGDPYYVLCTADLSAPGVLAPTDEDLAVMLVRVDDASDTITFASIPARLQLKFPDGKSYAIGEHPQELGDAGLISAIADFADVPISHYITTDAEQLAKMVGKVGSIPMSFATEIDDPSAGIMVIDAGDRQLSAEEALVVLRAVNVPGGFEGCAANRVAFTVELLSHISDKGGLELASLVSDASQYISTDWPASSLLPSAEAIQPISEATIYQCVVPYSQTTQVDDWSKLLTCNMAEWELMREAFKAGEDPSAHLDSTNAEALRACTVEIRNGASIDGAASSLGTKLESIGYTIGEVGNTYDGIVYPDTLVIYTDPENEGHAKTVLTDISQGRLVNGGDFYSTKSNVLVVIGADWVS